MLNLCAFKIGEKVEFSDFFVENFVILLTKVKLLSHISHKYAEHFAYTFYESLTTLILKSNTKIPQLNS
jgi:hypothetical protein